MVEPFILASSSASRRQMLSNAGMEFQVEPAGVEEPLLEDVPAAELPVVLAQHKARAVQERFPGRIIVGADQVVLMPGGAPAAAPADRDEARAQLRAMSGRTHALVSAAVVLAPGVEEVVVQRAEMAMRRLDDAALEAVLDWNEWQGCAGAYRFEERGVHLVEHWDGDLFCVLGLPLVPLLGVLRDLGCGPLESPAKR